MFQLILYNNKVMQQLIINGNRMVSFSPAQNDLGAAWLVYLVYGLKYLRLCSLVLLGRSVFPIGTTVS